MQKFDDSPLRNINTSSQGERKSAHWYIAQVRKLGIQNPRTALQAGIGELTWNLNIGDMVLFYYDAKTKDRLPYWDKFPLVFPFAKTEGGFRGLNLHYLPPLMRSKLLEQLLHLKNTHTLTETTRLRLSWDILHSVAQRKLFEPCVKQYLRSHIMSRFLKIPAVDWNAAIYLPVDRFQKKSAQNVYRHLGLK